MRRECAIALAVIGVVMAGQADSLSYAQGPDLTYPEVTADGDGDGVADASDLCPAVYADTTEGCPLRLRTRIGYDVVNTGRKGVFAGFVVGRCIDTIPVRLYKKRPGPDRFVGSAITRTGSAKGYFRVLKPIRPGPYYVIAPRLVVEQSSLCPRFRSPIFDVPPDGLSL
jgi:hypothetical protein